MEDSRNDQLRSSGDDCLDIISYLDMQPGEFIEERVEVDVEGKRSGFFLRAIF